MKCTANVQMSVSFLIYFPIPVSVALVFLSLMFLSFYVQVNLSPREALNRNHSSIPVLIMTPCKCFFLQIPVSILVICLTVFCLLTDLFVCVEVDSYGHYFRKAKSKLVCNSANPRWNEEFVIELEGSQNLRILLYEESQDRAILRAKSTQKVK
jgi:hypothetical protein